MKQQNGDSSRDRILAAARNEFGAYGFAGARTERIAKRASVNKQLLFYYFGSKLGLYQAVVRRAGDAIRQAAARVRGAEQSTERLRRQLAQAFSTLASSREDLRLLLEGTSGPESDASDAQAPVSALEERIRGIVSEGQGLGFFRDDVDPAKTALHAVVLLMGYLALEPLLGQASSAPATAGDEWIASVTDLLVGFLTW